MAGDAGPSGKSIHREGTMRFGILRLWLGNYRPGARFDF